MGSVTTEAQFVMLGFGVGAAPAPTPAPTGSGGGYGRTFGFYPSGDKYLKPLQRKIEAKKKKLKKVETQMSFAVSQEALQRLLVQMTSIQTELFKMTEEYQAMVQWVYEQNMMIDDEEVLMLIL